VEVHVGQEGLTIAARQYGNKKPDDSHICARFTLYTLPSTSSGPAEVEKRSHHQATDGLTIAQGNARTKKPADSHICARFFVRQQ